MKKKSLGLNLVHFVNLKHFVFHFSCQALTINIGNITISRFKMFHQYTIWQPRGFIRNFSIYYNLLQQNWTVLNWCNGIVCIEMMHAYCLLILFHGVDACPNETTRLTLRCWPIFDINWWIRCIFIIIVIAGCMHYEFHAR